MVHAYLFFITGGGASPAVVEALTALPAVQEAHVVAGSWDVIAELEVENVSELQSAVTNEIQDIEGVGTTRTYVALG